MKKLLVMIAAMALSLGLLACNGTTTAAPTTAAPTTAAPTTVPPTTQAPDAVLVEIYEGSHTVSAMGSDVTYLYEIYFQDGTYYFISHFEMGGEEYTYEEEGTYSVSGTTITMTPEGADAVTGEVLVGGNISIPVKASAMGARALREMEAHPLARIYVGTHNVSAMGSDVTYVYQMTFMFGLYTFVSEFVMGEETYNFLEMGTYEVDGDVLTITPLLGDPVVGSINEGTITIGVKASAMGARADRTLNASTLGMYYEGSHTVSAMGSDVTYHYLITFKNGEYTLVSNFVMGEEDYEFVETGTYTVEGSVVTLTPEGGNAVTGSVHLYFTATLPIKASAMGARADRVVEFTLPEFV